MARFGVREVCDVTFYNELNEPVLFLDTLKLSNLTNDAERTYITGGKGNPRLLAFDYNRTASFEINDALLNPKSLALQSGTELEVDTPQTIHKREVLPIVGGSVTLSQTPNSDVRLYESAPSGDFDPTASQVVVAPAGTTIATTLDGTHVVAFYTFAKTTNTHRITIDSNKFGGFYKIVGDTNIVNYETKQIEGWQIIIPSAKINSAFEITLEAEGDASVFNMTLEIFKPDTSNNMIQFVKY